MWSFDGSSTNQAKAGKGENTDCLLRPVFVTNDPIRGENNKLVFCEVLNPDGTPHSSNKRTILESFLEEIKIDELNSKNKNLPWFGWEQEYTLTHKPAFAYEQGEGMPLGFTLDRKPRPQGDYYLSLIHI